MPQTSTSVTSAHVMNEIHPQLRPLFDPQANSIPVLRATCQKILNISGDTSNPDALAQVVSRDPGLTCKVLQIANGIAYSPQHTITSVSHAVTWLGLDTVRTLVATVQLMEQLEHQPDRRPVLGRLIAKALFAAAHASELGVAMNYSQPGLLFSAALLYSFADLVIAYQAPDLFHALTELKDPDDDVKILGVSRARFSTALAQTWVLPAGLMSLIGAPSLTVKAKWQTDQHLFNGLVVSSNHLIDAMIEPPNLNTAERIRQNLQRGTGLSDKNLQDALTRAFDKGHQLSRSVGISEHVIANALAPAPIPVAVSKDSSSNTHHPANAQPITQSAPPIHARPMETLQKFQSSLLVAKDFNAILSVLVNTLHEGAGFTRVALALLNPGDTDQLLGRVVVGVDTPAKYLSSFSGSLTSEHSLFLHILKGQDPFLLSKVSRQGPQSLGATFLATWHTSSAILAPIRIGIRPIGLLYSDRGPLPGHVSPEDLQTLQLFLGQTTLSLNRLAGVL
ncbi:MAG: HDOD domain-containing protein [Nitrospira sp.]|nr:HDOD domain-containing protein [Nitrospira sp.]